MASPVEKSGKVSCNSVDSLWVESLKLWERWAVRLDLSTDCGAIRLSRSPNLRAISTPNWYLLIAWGPTALYNPCKPRSSMVTKISFKWLTSMGQKITSVKPLTVFSLLKLLTKNSAKLLLPPLVGRQQELCRDDRSRSAGGGANSSSAATEPETGLPSPCRAS